MAPRSPVCIGVVAPATPITRAAANAVIAVAGKLYSADRARVVFHPQCFERAGHFAGPDARRAEAFVEVANDPDVDAVWFARGGYGSARLGADLLDRLGPAARAKTYLGYSDLGHLMARVYVAGIGRVVHGPVANDILRDGGEAAVTRALRFLVEGDQSGIEPTGAGAPRAAFNLVILSTLIGTPHLPDLTGHELLVEEVAEYHYAIDRALGHVLSAPAIAPIAGLRLGRCVDIPENDVDFGQDEAQIAAERCARAGIAYLGRADIGHDAENKLVVFGAPGGVAPAS